MSLPGVCATTLLVWRGLTSHLHGFTGFLTLSVIYCHKMPTSREPLKVALTGGALTGPNRALPHMCAVWSADGQFILKLSSN